MQSGGLSEVHQIRVIHITYSTWNLGLDHLSRCMLIHLVVWWITRGKRDRNIAIYLPDEKVRDKNLQNKGSNLNSRSHTNCYGIVKLVTSSVLI